MAKLRSLVQAANSMDSAMSIHLGPRCVRRCRTQDSGCWVPPSPFRLLQHLEITVTLWLKYGADMTVATTKPIGCMIAWIGPALGQPGESPLR